MIGTVGLVTDSNSQLPAELVDRYGVEVVPLTVTVDGVDHLEGIDLDADGFWARFADGPTPVVATAQPSPGAFAEAYARLAARGATEILSIHIGSAISGTLNSARLAADGAGAAVHLVDTGTASFGIACCVWEAAEALLAGAEVAEAARRAEALVARTGNVFVVGALDLARRGGRFAATPDPTAADPGAGGPTADDPAVPVLSLVAGQVQVVGTAVDVAAAADAMATHIAAAAPGPASLRVAVGIADAAGEPVRLALEARLAESGLVADLVHYRIGPSVGAHTGPGTAGAFWFEV